MTVIDLPGRSLQAPAPDAEVLSDLDRPVFAVRDHLGVRLTHAPASGDTVLTAVGPLRSEQFGDAQFRVQHGVTDAYMAGAMANGIASEELVVALARSGRLASFGAAGLLPERISSALDRFEREIPGLPFACNLIHSPAEERLERDAVELFLNRGVRCVEASAYLDLTPHVVRYRTAGLRRGANGQVVAENRLVAKVSRQETAAKFLAPAPIPMVRDLLAAGDITAEQAELAVRAPLADDITVEGDSGGHTDRRPLHALLPTILRLRDEAHEALSPASRVRVGAAGGIGTPGAVLAAFAAGAAYVVTGSVNQACIESGASDATRRLLAMADVADCEMAPAADMFEMGVELQVLRRGTMFPMRARRLYDIYRTYPSLAAIPDGERAALEQQLFRASLDTVWAGCQEYFSRRDPAQIARAADDPKRQMALVFRWYLGMSSRWSNTGQPDRVLDYQIWCGPAMGAFNDWVRRTYLEDPDARRVADVAGHLLRGAAYEARVHQLQLAGVSLPLSVTRYVPRPAAEALR